MSQIIGKRAKNEVQQCDNFKPFFQEAGSAYTQKNARTLYYKRQRRLLRLLC